MDIGQAERRQLPFQSDSEPLVIVHYESQIAAARFLHQVMEDRRGTGLLYGPPSSGKKTLMRQFVGFLPADLAIATIDGSRLNANEFLESVLSRFGYDLEYSSSADWLDMLTVFVRQQTRINQPPLLVIHNFDRMHPSALRCLCKLAELRLHHRVALRIILISERAPYSIVHAPAMSAVANRMPAAFELGPMTARESFRYLYSKLRASGFDKPEGLMPVDVCIELHRASGGWPGRIDELAMLAMQRAGTSRIQLEHVHEHADPSPPAVSPPLSAVQDENAQGIDKLFLTLNGKTLQEFELEGSKILIGRSEFCDLKISSRYVSKFHAMLLRKNDSVHLIDLNSSNGTFVNSRRVQIEALRHEDVISLGNHGIKLISPSNRTRAATVGTDLADTATMKTLTELRRTRAGPVEDEGYSPAVNTDRPIR
ncbi:MAG: FHA domain-containing protein [Gammaproteobacteria bacterium]|nr:FHA domain-containing protein [Gammaproteobacteria bacterium]MDH4314024.1 FHA domain-containing protein [Gammaproteobacteria bacterium]